MTESKSNAGTRIAPAGLMFLAITSVGWGFNWPVTKYLLSELVIIGLAFETTQLEKVTQLGWWLLVYSTVIQFGGPPRMKYLAAM